MLKNLILIENDEKYQYDTLEELVCTIIDKDFYQLSDAEKKEKLELKAVANSIQEKILDKNYDVYKNFVLNDEITYIYSLLMLNKIMILENVESNYLTQNLDKTNIDGNYIIVNKFAKELLGKYLERG
jgi:hypothetical protein